MLTFQTPLDLVRVLRPEAPVACVRPERVALASGWFQENFPGEVLYAVKANPSVWALDAMYGAGQRWFDCASLNEIELIAGRYDDAVIAFMHPVKSRATIERAYFEFGVRIFVLDCEAELNKILEATKYADDLTLVVRIAVSNSSAGLPLTGKFGCAPQDAPDLLQKTRRYADELGVSFHVGSQCMDPWAYRGAMDTVSSAILHAAVTVDIVDVGGGFPVSYPGMEPVDLKAYVDIIVEVFEEMPVLYNADLWCEPGRAMVAEATSILVKVELAKGEDLHINDGSYGNLFDAAHCSWRYPVRVHRTVGQFSHDQREFKVYGPTCDSIDVLDGMMTLPADINEGDYIEFGMMGAYGAAMATQFNGFGQTQDIKVREFVDQSMYPEPMVEEPTPVYADNVIHLPLRASR